MAKIKLTKSVVDAAKQQGNDIELRDTLVPAFGIKKAHEVTRQDITALMKRMKKSPIQANRVLSCLRKMFNLAELWGYRSDGSNPCRHVPKYPEKGSTRLITDDQMVKLFAYLDKAEAEKLEHPTYLLAICLQFEFAARNSEYCAATAGLAGPTEQPCRVA